MQNHSLEPLSTFNLFTRVARWLLFKQKNPNFGKFWRASDGKMLKCFMAILNFLKDIWDIFDHVVRFLFIWYIFTCFGFMYQEKSGNPAFFRGKAIFTTFSRRNLSGGI
jgi:hypothetical protein